MVPVLQDCGTWCRCADAWWHYLQLEFESHLSQEQEGFQRLACYQHIVRAGFWRHSVAKKLYKAVAAIDYQTLAYAGTRSLVSVVAPKHQNG